MEFLRETVEVLGGAAVFRHSINTAQQLDAAARLGLPTGSITALGTGFGIQPQRILPATTWKRRLKAGRLSPDESDKAVRIAHVLAVARHVLGPAMVPDFLSAALPELGGSKPADAILSEIGAREVEAILWRIFYGLPA
ncbi:antitoxin Xre/MbcA/ParS toxin-binding domain-containing protein [Ferrovibrio sp.]|uniref:antitoxin Xre/MbcA/ParS toxin-binding domain-containing protein n=1 Tax=Ferrovibrio sp. TaxID=1917215 RepID=UPI001B5FA0B7|nr:antitoxin Xre/MbcA/ParS toxin-binding domain-containing protein [Ferrovibrio sp.]MBP7062620.1 DUF2384 domain-containing protein [Ferrovibrio sp.]